jgi:hypothetical protein
MRVLISVAALVLLVLLSGLTSHKALLSARADDAAPAGDGVQDHSTSSDEEETEQEEPQSEEDTAIEETAGNGEDSPDRPPASVIERSEKLKKSREDPFINAPLPTGPGTTLEDFYNPAERLTSAGILCKTKAGQSLGI